MDHRTAESFALRLAQFRASGEESTHGCPWEQKIIFYRRERCVMLPLESTNITEMY